MNRRIRDAQALGGSRRVRERRRRPILAALLLGLLLAAGWGDGRAAAESEIEALRRAAAEGDAGALFSLADRHERGDGLEHDLAAAAAYLRLAAERGHPEAQYRLGLLYAGGVGLPGDRVEGYRWLSLAADADEDGAAGLLAEALRAALRAEMAPEEIERGKELAAAFSPIHGPAELPALEGVAAPPTLAALEAFLAEISCDEVEPSLCRVLNLLREHPTKLDPEMDVVLRDADGEVGGVFEDGDYLVIELPVFDEPRYLAVDYFIRDGEVLHLFPDRGVPGDAWPAGRRLVLGDPTTGGQAWRIGPPFGRDLLAVFVSERPLYRARRPQMEPTAAYLDFLRGRLNNVAPGDSVQFYYSLVTTVPRGPVASGDEAG